jgi:hypothetical protein
MPAMAIPGTPGSPGTTGGIGSPSSPSRPTPPSAPTSGDWPRQATDSIIRLVDNVRDRTSGPAVTAARAVVYGSIIAILGLPLFILTLVGAMRLFEHGLLKIGEWQQWTWMTDPMWFVYEVFGTSFVIVGVVLWGKARKSPAVD